MSSVTSAGGMGLLRKKWMNKPLNANLLAVIANLKDVLME